MQIVNGKEQEYREYVAKNTDPYGAGVVRFSERWADAMEAAMAKGESLPAAAERLSHEVDTEGITGFMYGCAVSALAYFWTHGDDLRRWHNGEYGVSEEKAKGGVVNPAIMTIDDEAA